MIEQGFRGELELGITMDEEKEEKEEFRRMAFKAVLTGIRILCTYCPSKVGGNYMAGISFRCRKLRVRHARQLGGNYMAENYMTTVLTQFDWPTSDIFHDGYMTLVIVIRKPPMVCFHVR